MPRHPQVSFKHVFKEISENRENLCELVRELISNSYDAGAKSILILPLLKKRGLVFHDDGCGLSDNPDRSYTKKIAPWDAFFSVGTSTKAPGKSIGYKCQGSKLCFDSERVTVISRCRGEECWRWKDISNPRDTMHEYIDIEPELSSEPWTLLSRNILDDQDPESIKTAEYLCEKWFQDNFGHQGTMIIVHGYSRQSQKDYYEHFVLKSEVESYLSYLYNYIRFFTAHGDVRDGVTSAAGFEATDVKAFSKQQKALCSLQILANNNGAEPKLIEVPRGYKFLHVPPSTAQPPLSPVQVQQLRKGQFYARFAARYEYQNKFYDLVLAVDGKRRCLGEKPVTLDPGSYHELGRQGDKRSGISLATQRGVMIASQGVRIAQYNALLDHKDLEKWAVLKDGTDHFAFIINGDFKMVTNRNAFTSETIALLTDSDFVSGVVKHFFEGLSRSRDGKVFHDLIARLSNDRTAHRENEYIDGNDALKSGMVSRCRFQVDIPSLSGKWMVAPENGEEFLVGSLYTLLSHAVEPDHPLAKYWKRPLTFSARGIDAIAVGDENLPLDKNSLLSIEYKYWFNAHEGFNHPFVVTDVVVCWDFDDPEIGEPIEDDYEKQGTVESFVYSGQSVVGFEVGSIYHKPTEKSYPHNSFRVLSLKRLMQESFPVKWRSKPTPVTVGKTKPVKRRR